MQNKFNITCWKGKELEGEILSLLLVLGKDLDDNERQG